jgi:hypothetical protein
MTIDQVNAAFEAAGAGAALLNVMRLYRDKTVQGVSPGAVVFFTAWGAWNLHYYQQLTQPLSQLASLCVFAANAWWLILLGHYTLQGRRNG